MGFNIAFGVFNDNLNILPNFEQYFKLRVRNYAFVSKNGGVGTKSPDAFVKSAKDGWVTEDGLNYWQEVPFHKCTLAELSGFSTPNENYVDSVNKIFS